MNAINEINRKSQANEIFLLITYNNVWIKCVLFTLPNSINKLKEIVERSKKASARLKRAITIKFYLYKILTIIRKKEERLNFHKTQTFVKMNVGITWKI